MERTTLLHVLVGSSHLPSDDPTPSLVVEAESERLEELRQQLATSPDTPKCVCLQALLAASDQAEQVWFRFSDSRFNSVIPLERWREFYPNLQLQHQEALRCQTLAAILAQWPAANDAEQGISLTISQGDPVEVLKGADTWLQRIHRIDIRGPKADILWQDACGTWLEQQGFQRESESSLTWTLDEKGRKLIQQRLEIDKLNQQLSAGIPEQQKQLEESNNRFAQALNGLKAIFPYSAYREKRPDLDHISDPDLISHFLADGIHEGVDLQFSSLQSEWKQSNQERPEGGSFLDLLGTGEKGIPIIAQQEDPEPTIQSLSPIEETEICGWWVDHDLYISIPEEFTKSIAPAIYKGSQGFALKQTSWSEEILDQLTANRSHQLFSIRNRHLLDQLMTAKNGQILDAGINKIPYFSIEGSQTLHVHLGKVEENLTIPLIEEFEITCSSSEVWTFETLLALHRAVGSLEVVITNNGKSKSYNIDFDPVYTGGTATSNFLKAKVELPLEKGITTLTISIKHSHFLPQLQDRFDSYYFVANPVLRSCGVADGKQNKLEPRPLQLEQDANLTDVLYAAKVTPFASSEDECLVLSLGNGTFHELFSPLKSSIKLTADYSHTLIFATAISGDFALCGRRGTLGSTFCILCN